MGEFAQPRSVHGFDGADDQRNSVLLEKGVKGICDFHLAGFECRNMRLPFHGIVALLALLAAEASAADVYVDLHNTNPIPPFTNWNTAATNIQDAVDAAQVGDTVMVTNGVYEYGGRTAGTNLTLNRVLVDKPLTLQSVNGPQVTTILGVRTGDGGAVRCVWLGAGAVLSGFTLRRGITLSSGDYNERSGGGLFCESVSSVASNCVFMNNSANYTGGGVYKGTLNNCILDGNNASEGGGAAFSILNGCTVQRNRAGYGGGAYYATLNNCTIQANETEFHGGGTFSSTLNHCTVVANRNFFFGGGAYLGTLNNCTLVNNAAYQGGGACRATLNQCLVISNSTYYYSTGAGGGALGGVLNNCALIGNFSANGGGACSNTLFNCTVVANAGWSGGGVSSSTVYNSIVYFNNANGGSNYLNSTLDHCSTLPHQDNGRGNFTNAPLFVDLAGSNLRLQSNSPCINSGSNALVPGLGDLDGRPRIVNDIVDVGAYEYNSEVDGFFLDWLGEFGLSTDGSMDFIDSDKDGMNNWQEWICRTHPFDSLSVLKMQSLSNNPFGVTVSWQSVSNRTYFLQRSINILQQSAFSTIQSNILGQGGTTTFTDTDVTNVGPYFYRAGVQH